MRNAIYICVLVAGKLVRDGAGVEAAAPARAVVTEVERKPHAVRVRWQAPAEDGGSPVERYVLRLFCDGDSAESDGRVVEVAVGLTEQAHKESRERRVAPFQASDVTYRQVDREAPLVHTFEDLPPKKCYVSIRTLNRANIHLGGVWLGEAGPLFGGKAVEPVREQFDVPHYGCGNWFKHCCYRSDLEGDKAQWMSSADPQQGPVCTAATTPCSSRTGGTWSKGAYYGCGHD